MLRGHRGSLRHKPATPSFPGKLLNYSFPFLKTLSKCFVLWLWWQGLVFNNTSMSHALFKCPEILLSHHLLAYIPRGGLFSRVGTVQVKAGWFSKGSLPLPAEDMIPSSHYLLTSQLGLQVCILLLQRVVSSLWKECTFVINSDKVGKQVNIKENKPFGKKSTLCCVCFIF